MSERDQGRQAGPERPLQVPREPTRAGRPLDREVRPEMEARLGRDLSGVRIHDDSEAAKSAAELDAAAFTTGSSVVFAQGRYDPQTPAGRRLLAHELTHVVQQREASTLLPTVSKPGDASERAAEQVAAGSAPGPGPTTVPAVQRQPVATPDVPAKANTGRATEDEVLAKLTEFLTRVLAAQGGQTLRESPQIEQALHTLAQGNISAVLAIDAFLAQKIHPGSPAEYAKAAMAKLPRAISKADLAKLDRIPDKPTASNRPGSFAEAIGWGIVDQTIAPIIKKLGVSKETKAKLIELARSAVASGVASTAAATIKSLNLDPQAQAALSAAIEAAIKQKASAPPSPPAGRDLPPQPPPSTAAPMPPVPGAVNSPPIPIPDVPDRKQPKPVAPTPPTVEQLVEGLDDNALIPASARAPRGGGRGPLAAELSSARDFARALADQLAAAQRSKRFTVEMSISHSYREVDDVPAVLDEVERIVKLVAGAALPAQGSNVGEVIVTVADTHIRRVVKL